MSTPTTPKELAAAPSEPAEPHPTAAPSAQEPSPTAGMNIAQRILHVGGRNNAAGYIEFGSIQAVQALVRQVLRDMPVAPHLAEQAADHPEQLLNMVHPDAEPSAQEPVAWLYTLEYGASIVDKKVSARRLNYPFGVCGADYSRANNDGVSYVRETPLYTAPQPAEAPADAAVLAEREACAKLCDSYAKHLRAFAYDSMAAAAESCAESIRAGKSAPAERQPLTDEQIDLATAAERDALLDHIYEHGTTSEGVQRLVRKLARAAIAKGIGKEGGAA